MGRFARPLVLALLTACGDGAGGAGPGTDAALPADDLGAPLPDSAAVPEADAAPPSPDAAPPPLVDAATPDAGAPIATLGDGRFQLEVQREPFALILRRDGAPVAHLRGLEVAFAETEAEANDRTKFFDPANPRVYTVEWRALSPASEALPLRLQAGDFSATLDLRTDAEGRFTAELIPDAPGRLVLMRLVLDAPPDEAYYGLGELFDTPQHRGKQRPMHISADVNSEGFYTEYHVAVPLLIGTQGWGLFVEERRPGNFDVAATDAAKLQVTFEAKRLRFHLFGADTPTDVLPHYVALTGQPARPAEWAFGGWMWRNENRNQQQVLDDIAALRAHDVPMSGLWFDRPWSTDLNSFVFDPEKFPDPGAMLEAVHAAGLRWAVWASPYIEPSSPEAYQTAQENDWFVHLPEGWFKPFDEATFVDLTNPAAVEFFSGLIRRVTDLGAQGFKLDYGEDIQVGIASRALPFDFHNGETERTMHHGIAEYYHRPFAALTGGDGQNFILSRAGTYGDQTLTTTIWPGDLCNGFEQHLENRHVGGLPAAISGGLSLSTSGYPFYASDTGGYRHGRASKEVFLRWTAYSALGSLLQTGGSDQHLPWDFMEYDTGREDGTVSRFDEETLDIYRQFARLYIRLHAYRHPFNEEAHRSGRPVTRPTGFAFPELGLHPATQFLLGDALLVAPVTDASGAVDVIVPPGRWYEWYSGEAIDGPATIHRDIPLDRVALYARAGAVVPMLRETVDTLAVATDPEVDSYANDPGVLTVRLYPGEGARTLETLGGTTIAVDGRSVTLAGDHFTGYVFELHGLGDGETLQRIERGPGAQTFELP